MSDYSLDDKDKEILYYLQEDARNNTNAEISEQIGLSPSTVGKRIKRLESEDIIKGYHPDIDYDQADYPLHVPFICTTTITGRADLIQEVLALPGVVNVQELMTGEENVHIEVVGSENDDITKLATAIDELPIDITEEILVKNDYPQPASIFSKG